MTDSYYDDIDVTTVVNSRGSITQLGGSRMPPAVIDAMERAAGEFVHMEELMDWAGRQVAAVTGADEGLVTSGASAGVLLAGAACLTGRDRTLMDRLPDTTGIADEFVIQDLHRIDYARGVRTAGGSLVTAGDESGTSVEELEAAIGEETAGLLHMVLDPQPTVSLEEAAEIAHRNDVPVIVDAAAELPPPENLHRFLDEGADLVIFSGGKNIRGPNDTGLLFGRGELMAAAKMQAFPHDEGIGRPLKVSKEQIVGQVTALRRWVDLDHDALLDRWRSLSASVCESLSDVAGVTAEVAVPDDGPRPLIIPRARIEIDEAVVGKDPEEIDRILRDGSPPVIVSLNGPADTLWVNPEHLEEAEAAIVAERLRSVIEG